MIDEDKIKHYLQHFETLQLTDLQKLFDLARPVELREGQAYIRAGSLHRKLCYVKQGLIRSFTFRDNGDEATLQLYWEDQFFASRHSVLLDKPSAFHFEALEETVLLEVDFAEMMELLDQNPQFAKARNFFLTTMLSDAMDRVEDFVLLSAEERYLKLLREKPDINQRVHDKHIATILGITPVSLSRIRKRIASRR